jgi:DNA primase
MSTPVEEIKERLDIVDVIGRYVPLKKTGRNLKGLCPFHTEKTPSFIVYPADGHYHCFGCGQSGDIFTLVMKLENLDFSEALRVLADRAGVPLVAAPQAVAEDRTRDRLRELNAAAAQFFHNLLLRSPEGQVARDFLARRGVDAGAITGWQLGYSLDSWDALTRYLTGKGYVAEDLLAAGLVRKREDQPRTDAVAPPRPPRPADDGTPAAGANDEAAEGEVPSPTPVHTYDYFRRRLMFPIRDAKGNVTGFGARTLGDDLPKFLNSPQTLLFDKSASLYGIEHAREVIRSGGQAVIVEGYLDVLIAHQMGISNVVASLGTALTERQLGILKKLGKRLILALDADAAGDEATLRGLAVAREVMDRVAVPVPTWRGLVRFEYRLDADLRILSLPRGEDPDDVILRSVAEWQQRVADALPVVDFYFRVITSRLDLATPKGKSAAVDQLLPLIREIDDRVAQAHYIHRLANLVQVDETVLADRVRALRAPGPPSSQEPREPVPSRQPFGPEEYCLSYLLRFPALYWKVEGLAPEDFGDTANRQIFGVFRDELATNARPDAGRLRELLDPALQEQFDALLRAGESLPAPSEDDLANEVVVAALRVRLADRRRRVNQLTFAQRDPDIIADPEQVHRLNAMSEQTGQEIDYLQKAMSERTFVGRKKARGG